MPGSKVVMEPHGKLSIVACYAPTNEADEIEKDNFYETLQSIVAEIPRHNIICVVGDVNAKVGSCRNYSPEVMGQHEIGDMNENGALLVDFALNNDLVIGVSYREIDKQVKKSVQTDKRQFIEQKAALAEEAAKKGDLKTVYRLTNEMIGVKPNRTNLVRDENGALLTDPLMIDERWAAHLENLLNRPRINDQDIIPDTPFMILNVNEEPPSPEEIIATFRKLRNGRMLGVDGITSEMLKTSVRKYMTVWVELLTQIWSDQKVPSDWTKGTIIRLFKKGDALVCGNWRGINIMLIPIKLL
ncbi:uncharacterized protein LOC136040326 [Artemia franciscana]|uniref:uncharacterized protein LOC136040326 n=1 Tax=Artemia franciscana TaxID=6661 RepID=UPI0032D9CEA9